MRMLPMRMLPMRMLPMRMLPMRMLPMLCRPDAHADAQPRCSPMLIKTFEPNSSLAGPDARAPMLADARCAPRCSMRSKSRNQTQKPPGILRLF